MRWLLLIGLKRPNTAVGFQLETGGKFLFMQDIFLRCLRQSSRS